MSLSELICTALLNSSYEEQFDAIEKALSEAKTESDWQECFDAFGERTIGEFICEWADETAYGPAESEGLAYLVTDDGKALVSQWFNDGRYDVTFTTVENAVRYVNEINAECEEIEKEEEEGC